MFDNRDRHLLLQAHAAITAGRARRFESRPSSSSSEHSARATKDVPPVVFATSPADADALQVGRREARNGAAHIFHALLHRGASVDAGEGERFPSLRHLELATGFDCWNRAKSWRASDGPDHAECCKPLCGWFRFPGRSGGLIQVGMLQGQPSPCVEATTMRDVDDHSSQAPMMAVSCPVRQPSRSIRPRDGARGARGHD